MVNTTILGIGIIPGATTVAAQRMSLILPWFMEFSRGWYNPGLNTFTVPVYSFSIICYLAFAGICYLAFSTGKALYVIIEWLLERVFHTDLTASLHRIMEKLLNQ
jgi:hypothetical protein